MRAKNKGIGKMPTAMIRRVFQCAICLVVISISGSVFDAEKMVINVSIWREHNTIEATVGLYRRRDEIIRRLVELLNARLGPDRAKHVFYHYWTFA
jgi:hypothetical protein